MVLLNSGPNDYHRLFVLVVDTLTTVSLNSRNWFWRDLCFFDEFVIKMLRLMLFSNSSLANCKTKNIKVLHSDVGLCRVSSLFLDILLKTAWLCDVWLQKCGAANFVPFFGHPIFHSTNFHQLEIVQISIASHALMPTFYSWKVNAQWTKLAMRKG